MLVTPRSWAVPRLTVTNSRMRLRSPMVRSVGSPPYFLSWGSSPTEANWKIRLSRPMRVGPRSTTWGPMRVPGPISTPGPITVKGPTSTLGSSLAWGSTTALGWIDWVKRRSPGPCT
jgi:hypothetical protein